MRTPPVEIALSLSMLAAYSRQRRVRRGRLVQQRRATPPAVAHASHAERRRQRALHAVAHRVCQRQVKDIAPEAVVEGVTAHVVGRFEPTRQRERTRPRTSSDAGNQSSLDLRGEGEVRAPLGPLEEVGVAPIGDDHESQSVSLPCDLDEHLVAGRPAAPSRAIRALHHARSPARHRPHRSSLTVGTELPWREHLGPAECEGPVHRRRRRTAAARRTPSGRADRSTPSLSVRPTAARHAGARAQPDQPATGQISDEERHGQGTQGRAQFPGDGFDGVDGGRGLGRVQHPAHGLAAPCAVRHPRSIGA